MKIREFLKLVRFEHAIMLAIAVLIAETIVLGHIPEFTIVIILSLLVPVFSEFGSFALNDYLDVESDKINKRTDRPLVSGSISTKFAFTFSIFSFVLSVLFAFFINIPALIIAFVFNLFAILYNYKLKDLPVVGNLYIATTMAVPFIFGNFVINEILNAVILVLAVLGFLAGFAREIIKSTQDMEGDRKARKSRTLPIIIGEGKSVLIASALYIIFVLLAFLPFFYGLSQDSLSIALVIIADLIILYIVFNLLKKPGKASFELARNFSLIALFIGLIAYLLASV